MSNEANTTRADAPDRLPAAGGVTLAAARQRYHALALDDPGGALRHASSVLPRFAGHQFFYMQIFRFGDDPARRRAAELAVHRALAGGDVPPRVLAKAVRLLERLGAPPPLLEAARTLAASVLSDGGDQPLAPFRDARLRGADEGKEARVGQAGDRAGIVARGVLAYRSGRWGERMEAMEALRRFRGNPRARDVLDRIDGFLQRVGTSAAEVLRAGPEARAALQSPACVFEVACRGAPPASLEGRRGTVVMIPNLCAGGAERIAAHVHRGLKERGEDVALWLHATTDRRGGDGLFYLPLSGAEVVQVVPQADPAEAPFNWLPRAMGGRAQAIHDRLLAARPRAVHLSLDGPNLAGGLAAVLAGVPRIVLHCHNMWPGRLFTGENSTLGWDRAYRALLQRPEVTLVAVGRTVADDYLSRIGRDLAGKTVVVHNGIDLDQFAAGEAPGLREAFGIPAGAPVVGSAFRFEEVKRPELWLDMAALVHRARPDVRFVLFGDGVLLPRARDYAAELGLAGCVRFAGTVDDLHRRLPLLDVFALASRSEGLPNVLVEAQAAGAVPVAFDVGGCRETFVHGETGRLVPTETAEALAGAVLSALADDPWRGAARLKGRAFVRSRFSLDAMNARMAELLLGN